MRTTTQQSHLVEPHLITYESGRPPLGIRAIQFLDRRIADQQILTDEVAAWEASHNKKNAKADWHLTTVDARVKLKRLYPAM